MNPNTRLYKFGVFLLVGILLFNSSGLEAAAAIQKSVYTEEESNDIEDSSYAITLTTPFSNGDIYSGDTCTVEVSIEGNDDVASIGSVHSEVAIETQEKQTNELYVWDDQDEEINQWDGEFQIDLQDLEGEVEIIVIVEDIDENLHTSEVLSFTLVIENEEPAEPSVSISVDNSSGFIIEEGYYYKDGRNAIITVEDTDERFDQSIATESIKIWTVDESGKETLQATTKYTTTSWESTGDSHKINLSFTTDNHYKWAFAYENKEGQAVEVEDMDVSGESPFEFIIDGTASQISYEIKGGGSNQLYNTDVELFISVSENSLGAGIKELYYYINDNAQKNELYNLDAIEVTKDQLLYTFEADSIAFMPEDYDSHIFKITIVIIDNLGNESTEIVEFEIDKVAPIIDINYDNNQVYSGTYFNESRILYIEINERPTGFDGVEALEQINITKTLANGTKEILDLSGYKNDWKETLGTHVDDTIYSIEIPLQDDGTYNVSIEYTDLAGNTNNDINVKEDSISPFAFSIDTTPPTATVKAVASNLNIGEWKSLLTDYLFGYYTSSEVNIQCVAEDNIAGISSIEYYLVNLDANTKDAIVMTVDELEQLDKWMSYIPYVSSEESHFAIYYKITDNAGNIAYTCTDAILIDSTTPNVEKFQPIILLDDDQPMNGIYNTDIQLELKIIDPIFSGFYSGLQEISISVYDDTASTTVPTQKEIITLTDAQNIEIIESWIGTFVVKSSLNNSNNVRVVITARDRAQNVRIIENTYKIDTSKPSIIVEYDNNDSENGKYFSSKRQAKITVNERNFEASNMKIAITNSDGSSPTISGWSKANGSGNLDNTQWTAYITYTNNGDYTFLISGIDMAGNVSSNTQYSIGTVASNAFTIDTTVPGIASSYDNINAKNEKYYSAYRVQTIQINEHNFSENNTNVSIQGTDNGSNIVAPSVSNWNRTGDVSTAVVTYSKDGLYTVNVDTSDLAGNKNSQYLEESFYIDTIKPEIDITGVEDTKAYAGDVLPVITVSDTNIDFESITISLKGEQQGAIQVAQGSISGTQYQVKIDYFDHQLKKDDIYTLTVEAIDKAGNQSQDEIIFSVNRFGSTYIVPEALQTLLNKYNKNVSDIVFTEVNVNQLKNISVTIFKNNQTILLKENIDYKIEVNGGNNKWYEYTYTIFSSNFEDEGIYKIVVYSEDVAGNISENVLDTKGKELQFGVDKTDPVINLMNLVGDTTYSEEYLDVLFSVTDNLELQSVNVLLDDELILTWDSSDGDEDAAKELNFRIDGDTTNSRKVEILCADAAGNEAKEVIEQVYVTTSVLVKLLNSNLLLYLIILLVFTVGGITFIVRRKKS